ncbi:hypothetical protein J2858_000447 [Neorhizobium galegae]|uniref:DUF6456 domain-containing protein n=1 Tax=Neorhizobium galegae TaxID=399 RepID=UPI001AEABE09|nr:DUF6456 domain-containing protein [Neorhizobium galegae]MBP2547554.1 hypothetical protein [Neorhizobium galegae]
MTRQGDAPESGLLQPSRPLLRLLRQVSRGTCRIEPGEGTAEVILSRGDVRHRHPARLIEAAVTAGLAERRGTELLRRPETLTYLRRHLGDPGSPDADQMNKAFAAGKHSTGTASGRAGSGHPPESLTADISSETAKNLYGDQHRDIVPDTVALDDGRRETVRRNRLESPLSALVRLKDRDGAPFLSADAIAAGERLACDFDRGHLQPGITARWEPRLSVRGKGGAGGKVELAESAMAARTRVNRAIDAMGPELAGVALDICCFEKGLELVERERGWPVRSAKLMLRTALLALARHYAPPPVRAGTRSWGADGFRPQL